MGPDENTEWFTETPQHRMHNPDASGVTPDTSGVHQTKTQRALKLSLHRTLNSDASGVTPDASGVHLTQNSESFSEKAFSPDKTHQTQGGNCFRVRCLNSDTSDLIPDVSSLKALHETISNFFPCFHVPTPMCHNTCASVLAFSQIFLSRIQVSTLLDPNAYAQDMDLIALDSRDDRDFPS